MPNNTDANIVLTPAAHLAKIADALNPLWRANGLPLSSNWMLELINLSKETADEISEQLETAEAQVERLQAATPDMRKGYTTNDDTKLELVANNSADDVYEATRQRLAADINSTFGKMASNILEFLRGSAQLDAELIDEFRTADKAYIAEIGTESFTNKDGVPDHGIPIRVFDFSKRPDGEPDPDDATNTLIRGVLGMVSALLLTPSPDTEAYDQASAEFARGIRKANAKLMALKNPRTTHR